MPFNNIFLKILLFFLETWKGGREKGRETLIG